MALITPDLVTTAQTELAAKSKVQIETETAVKWAARAIAAYIMWIRTRDLQRFAEYVDYSHEACEHAASAGISAQLNSELTAAIAACGH